MTQHRKKIALIGIAIAACALLLGYVFSSYGTKSDNSDTSVAGTKIPEDYELMKDEPAAPNVNNDEFILVGSNINCSGENGTSCSGSIRVVPSNNQGYESGLYRIDQDTTLSLNGSDTNMRELEALASKNVKVRLTLAENSETMIKNIRTTEEVT